MKSSSPYNIQVRVKSRYLAEQSDPAMSRYVFAYHVTIANQGTMAAQLISRRWVITDAKYAVQEVRGEGVIGQQPRIAPGQTYEYPGGCVLTTDVGTMEGSYQVRGEDGEAFDAEIDLLPLP